MLLAHINILILGNPILKIYIYIYISIYKYSKKIKNIIYYIRKYEVKNKEQIKT